MAHAARGGTRPSFYRASGRVSRAGRAPPCAALLPRGGNSNPALQSRRPRVCPEWHARFLRHGFMNAASPSPSSTTPAPGPELRFAMLGMIDGNGHPWSWSAIINGYDRAKIASCPYPVIPQYLNAQPPEKVRVPGARVTHLWTDRAAEASAVAAAALIPHVVREPRDVIGEVDAVFVATDDGFDHVERARPFVEAG